MMAKGLLEAGAIGVHNSCTRPTITYVSAVDAYLFPTLPSSHDSS